MRQLADERELRFEDRAQAGRRLGERLEQLRLTDAVVLGLPRGGVAVAFEVARALHAPLDVVVVRKLGVPFQPELAMGAIGEGGVRVVNPRVVLETRVSDPEIAAVEALERAELDRRTRRYRGGRSRVDLRGRTAIVVDDGIATGSTAEAACRVVRALGAARVVLAVPVGARESIARLHSVADVVVCIETPALFFAIGQYYRDFGQLTDEDVVALLDQAATHEAAPDPAGGGARADPPVHSEEVTVPIGEVELQGSLALPEQPAAVVVFAHGSGSSRHSPRNRFVASVLQDAGLGTLLVDLLTPDEELSRANVFDIELLGGRLHAVTEWLRTQAATRDVAIAYFGASTGAAAALWAAAEPGANVAAVVSRGGRPDLAGSRLGLVDAPTLLIVGGHDEIVLDLNREAQTRLHCETRISVIAGATHLFEEPGALEDVARLAREWFREHLIGASRATA